MTAPSAVDEQARRLAGLLKERGATVATAESLTGGLVGAALTELPGSSAVYRGGVIVYATELKASLAGVPDALLEAVGPVHARTAEALATGVRDRLGSTYGLAATGVAGPDPQAGLDPGTVYVAAAGPGPGGSAGEDAPTVRVCRLSLSGDRLAIRRETVAAALDLCAQLVTEDPAEPGCWDHHGDR